MPDLSQLEADYERLWLTYNHLQQNLPRCEHVREWQEQIEAAGKAYRAALKTLDAAIAENGAPAEAPPVPVPPSLPVEPEPDDDGALFPLEAA